MKAKMKNKFSHHFYFPRPLPGVIGILFLLCLPLSSAHLFAQEPLFLPFREEKSLHTVLKVISVDTLELENHQRVRLIGLKGPAKPKRKKAKVNKYGIIIEKVSPITSFEEQAYSYVKELLKGKTVRLEYDKEKEGRDLKPLVYVFLPDGTFVNEEILRHGFAELTTSPLNKKYESRLRAAYQEARLQKRGLHSQ